MITLNNSDFSCNITGARDRASDREVSIFSYFNNPFSDGCDVANLSISYTQMYTDRDGVAVFLPGVLSTTISCDFPTTQVTFNCPWQSPHNEFPKNALDAIMSSLESATLAVLWDYYADVYDLWGLNNKYDGERFIVELDLAVECPPHDSECLQARPINFRSTARRAILLFPNGDETQIDNNFTQPTTGLPDQYPYYLNADQPYPDHPLVMPTIFPPKLAPQNSSDVVQNMMQALFHRVRLEMGVFSANQIYTSADMFNQSISPIGSLSTRIPLAGDDYVDPRMTMANETFFAELQQLIQPYTTTDRIPVMEYARTVPKLKPLGSAMTSVFVSTFAMLSTIWMVFSLVAGVLAKMYADSRRSKNDDLPGSHADRDLEKQSVDENAKLITVPYLARHPDETQTAEERIRHIEKAMKSMQLALRRRGILDDELEMGWDEEIS
ncbi:hypothetical protein R3P38DRAFT_416642 [Favolaschia claudopus]|uniref:Uncharacterized protein n=1 Tax=Favolaschia claudopus TaxID=2862362 RepID=A0AAV9ZHR1_9AGAR